MATTKITDLTAYTDPVSTDVLPIVDVSGDLTKKVSIADLMENAGAGAEATPGIAFDGDPNTGIYSPGADQIAISTGGTGRLYIDSSGNVGIGTSSPQATFHTNGAILSSGALATLSASNIFFDQPTSALSRIGVVGADTSTAGTLRISQYSSNGSVGRDVVSIDSSGNVGIGTTSPAGTLNVQGSTGTPSLTYDTANIANFDAGTIQLAVGINNTSPFGAYLQGRASNDAARVISLNPAGGNVGINTASPNSTLTVGGNPPAAGAIAAVGSSGGIALALSDNVNSSLYVRNASGGSVIGTDAGGNIRFATNGNGTADEKVRIDSSGRLLVGTSSASSADPSKLEVYGNGITNGDGGGSQLLLRKNEFNAGSQTADMLRLRSGTGTQGQLSLGLLTNSGGQTFGFIDQVTGSGLQFQTGGTERMVIDSSGNVGIGTTSPSSVLTARDEGGTDLATLRLEAYRPALRFIDINASTADAEIVANGGSIAFNIGLESSPSTLLSEKVRIDSSGRVGIGTSSPGAKLTVQDGSNATGAILVGANYDSTGLTNNQTKLAPIHMPHYTNAEEKIRLIAGYSDASQSIVSIGGGTGSANAATKVQIYTAANTTTTSGTAAITVDSSQRVGIGSTSPGDFNQVVNAPHLVVGNGATSAPGVTIYSTAAGTGILAFADGTTGNQQYRGYVQYDQNADQLNFGSNGPITFSTGTERARIDSSGRLLVGASSATGTPLFTVSGAATGSNTAVMSLAHKAAVTSGAQLGQLNFTGPASDNLSFARISAYADGTPSGTSTPGYLSFRTAPSGTTSPVERVRISSDGAFYVQDVYDSTTATSANVSVNSNGRLRRSTSSAKYKTNIQTLEDSYADALLDCRPVWYQSTCANDNPDYGYWGFIAEEVAEIDPRLVFWKTVDISHDENGSQVETPCDPEPEGVAYDRFVPHLLNLIKRQQQAIETLEAKVAALEAG